MGSMRVQNRLDLAAFPSPSLPRRCNSSLPTATNRLATHKSTLRAPVTCRGTHQSAAEGHRAAAAATTTRRRRSVSPTPRASAGPGGGPRTSAAAEVQPVGGARRPRLPLPGFPASAPGASSLRVSHAVMEIDALTPPPTRPAGARIGPEDYVA
jgi:hypothetical protein